MQKKALFAIFAIAMIAMMLVPNVFAWSYGDPTKTDDTTFEDFGPRADNLLIQMYATQTAELEAGMEVDDLDVTDWPLDGTHYDRYTTAPWNNSVSVLGYGPEFGIYLFDLNNNNNLFLGNPPDPDVPNPVYPNPMSDVDLRKACAYLSDRAAYINYIGPTTVTALYTPVGPSSGKYASPTIYPGGADEALCYLYSPAAANATMDAGGFPVGPDGWRYWDMDGDHVKDAGEDFDLKLVARVDDPNRANCGSLLYTELINAGVHTTLYLMESTAAKNQVMSNKDYHIYTGGWSLTVDPDFLILWHWDYYWHPGRPYNYAGCNSAAFNAAADGVQYANDQSEAVDNAHAAEYAYCAEVLSVPLWTSTGFKVVSRTYAGEEADYENEYWEGFVNVPGYGVDGTTTTFMNMHTENHEYGNYPTSNMTIRYGFKVQGVKQFNPVYAEWLWDNNVLALVGYEALLARNAYDLGQWMPEVASQYSVSTYLHPTYGTCTKVVFTLRPGVEWQDGTPVTIADVFFTFVEIDDILESRGFAPPWWISNVQNILSFSILDPYNFEVLLDVKSVFATGWIGGNRILPKHIWKPLCTTGDPSIDEPDPNMIGSGPFRMNEYEPDHHILLTANSAGKTVKSPLAGSTPITAKMGYYRYAPIHAYATVSGAAYRHKFNMSASLNTIDVHYVNEKALAVTCDLYTYITDPDGVVTTDTHLAVSIPALSEVVYNLSPYLQDYGLWNVTMKATFPDRPGVWQASTFFWVTLKEDITGKTWYEHAGYSTYVYKNELVSGDFKVDTKDVASAAKAFGTAPGDTRWNTGADIIQDYKIDVKDIAGIAKKFGWVG